MPSLLPGFFHQLEVILQLIPIHANSLSPKGGLAHGDMVKVIRCILLIPYLEVIQYFLLHGHKGAYA